MKQIMKCKCHYCEKEIVATEGEDVKVRGKVFLLCKKCYDVIDFNILR
ncbi:unnamed protein product [marine sediment metagenome]|uniref:Uncharacterized protein n=1 Tax=marine sediment metagenome TaxID=412755 RepID=X1LYH7_9ZZZZ